MLFATLVSTLLLASAAFAAPNGRMRRTRTRQSKPLQRVQTTGASAASNVSHTEYSSNWAGAVWDSYPSGTFYEVTGTFTVPTPSAPDGYAAVWVGIDGDTCGSAILQTGIDINYPNGKASYDAWYEWYPDYAYNFDGITISAGDVIKLTVTASSTTSGTAVVENVSNGQTVTQDLSYPDYPLCEQNAEWIVEDFDSGGGQVAFCDFGTVTFSDAVAYINGGGSVTPYGATEIDIEQNNVVLTSVSESSSGTVTIKYV